MARKKGTIDVTGLSIKDIMNIDLDTFNSLNESDLRRITSRLVSAGNKRIRALEKHDISSPALRSLGTDVRFSTKLPSGTNVTQRVNKLRQEFASVRSFLSMKTSTISGYNKYVKDVKEEIAQSMGLSRKDISNINVSRAFEILHKLQEPSENAIPVGTRKRGSAGSIHARDYIMELMYENPEISEEDIMRLTKEDYEEFYRNEKREDETNGIEIDDNNIAI